MSINLEALREAVKDMRYLLNRGYNRKTAADYIASRYKLSKEERAIIFRAVYPEQQVQNILKKLLSPKDIIGERLLIDGFNNIITLESALKGHILLMCDDGVIRDISYTSRKFKFSLYTEDSIKMIFELLKVYRPAEVIFLFDQQISFSGELASIIRDIIEKENLVGYAKTSKRNDKEILSIGEIIASSDSIIMEKARKIFDLAGYIIKSKFKDKILDITSFK
ncbi:MAG: DUF434 domain-containing protein [Candidatus Methanomethylicia archaeon]